MLFESKVLSDDEKEGAKSLLLQRRLGAIRQEVNAAWKSERQMYARSKPIYVAEHSPLYKELKGLEFDPKTGYWLKDKNHPCHWADAFFHAIGNGKKPTIYSFSRHSVHSNPYYDK